MNIPVVDKPLAYPNKDTVKLLVKDGGRKFPRPYIRSGGGKFTWPVGTEGVGMSGSATVGVHKYIGAKDIDAHVIHFDEAKIEMTGLLPGLQSSNDVASLRAILTSTKDKVLYLPGVMAREEFVIVENYDFRHADDDKTHSFTYTISFWRSKGSSSSSGSGRGLEVTSPDGSSPQNPQRGALSESTKTITVTDGAETFRQIAQKVYGNADQWPTLVDLNKETIQNNNPGIAVNPYQMAYFRWPIGTRIRY